MVKQFNKPIKVTSNLLETAFLRLFAPISIIGAASLGAETAILHYAYFVFLLFPLIDTVRCLLYFMADHPGDPTNKRRWDKFYYGFKVTANILGSIFMVMSYEVDGCAWMLFPGQLLFIVAVVGLTAVHYGIKALGGLKDDGSKTKIETGERFVKNALLAATLLTTTAALSLIFLYPDITVSHEPIGWFLIIIANSIPIIGFALHYNDKWLMGSGTLLLVGIGLLFGSPSLSAGMDAALHTEVGIGCGLVLAGFVIAIVRDVYKNYKKFEGAIFNTHVDDKEKITQHTDHTPDLKNKSCWAVLFRCIPGYNSQHSNQVKTKTTPS